MCGRVILRWALAAAVLSGGCAPGVHSVARPAAAPAPLISDDLVGRFASARSLMEGFPRVDAGGRWRPGDGVLLGVAEDGKGPPREWYMRVEVLPPLPVEFEGLALRPSDSFTFRTGGPGGSEVTAEFGLVPLRVQVYDGSLAPVSESVAWMPDISLRYGLVEHVRLEREGASPLDPAHNGPVVNGRTTAGEEQVRALAGILAIVRFPQFVRRVPSAERLVLGLVERPPLFSVIANGGVTMSVRLAPAQAEEVAPPPGVPEPVYRVPVWVEMNGRRAVECEVILAAADPPLGPCNGVLAVEARHPTHPERRVRVRLLAAVRGAGGEVAALSVGGSAR